MGEMFQNFPMPVPDGLRLPSVLEAGVTPLHVKQTYFSTISDVFVNTGWGFTTLKPGAYRLSYAVSNIQSTIKGAVKIKKNGVDVEGSQLSATFGVKTVDVELAMGDTVALWLKHDRSAGDEFTRTIYLSGFSVSILVPDMQALINKIIIPT